MPKIIMTAAECANRHIEVATKFKTVYGYAMYGWQITDANIDAKARQDLNQWYSKNNGANEKKLRKLVGKGYWGFDCVNLTKAILWGWTGDSMKALGGAAYGMNGVPDTNANGMIQKCYDVSTDFSQIAVGEGLWLSGHWGMYVGNGLAVECTNWSYHDGVQITAVLNIGKNPNYKGRKWTKHGKLPWLDYSVEGVFQPIRNGMIGERVKQIQQWLSECSYSLGRWGVDGDFGAATENAVMAFQDDSGLKVTGVVDEETYTMLAERAGIVDKPVDKPKVPANPAETYSVVIAGLTKAEADGIKASWPKAFIVKET